MKRIGFLLATTFTALFCANCTKQGIRQEGTAHSGDEGSEIRFERGLLTGSRLNCELDVEDVRATCDSIPPQLLTNGVKCYRIDYYTLFEDSPSKASALLVIPQKEGNALSSPGEGTNPRTIESASGIPVRLAVYCHGTNIPIPIGNGSKMFSDYPGPGKGSDYNEICTCSLPLGGAGFCTLVPEYAGYGFTDGQDHPFVYFPELCKSIIDGIYAARTFLRQQGMEPGKDLFLSGWSQGAGACLATQKYLQESCDDDFNFISTSCLSGPYNITHFMEDLFSRPHDVSMNVALYAWACYCINRFAPGLNRPADQIFCHSTPDQLSSFLGTGLTPATVFRPFFIKGVMNETDTVFRKALEQDSFHSGWKPEGHIYLHHGTDDTLVPFFNSEDAKKGLDPDDEGIVSLIPHPGEGHDTFVGRYMTATITAFNADAGNADAKRKAQGKSKE